MKKSKQRLCYLCGQPGADSKDHVPPKGLLPPGDNIRQRVTVPAHRKCNSDESADEEYLRDLLLPEAMQYGLPDAEKPYLKVWKAWSRSAGWKRYQEFMATARPVKLFTKEGLYAGRAIGILPDKNRLISVGKKITRGIIFHDAEAIIIPDKIAIAPLSLSEAIELREKDANERYWMGLNHHSCKHSQFANSVAIRRYYQGHGSPDGVIIEAHLGIILWNVFFVVSTIIPSRHIKNNKFKFVIDTKSGEWVKNENL